MDKKLNPEDLRKAVEEIFPESTVSQKKKIEKRIKNDKHLTELIRENITVRKRLKKIKGD